MNPSSRLVSSRLVSSRLVSSRLVSSRLVSSRLVSFRDVLLPVMALGLLPAIAGAALPASPAEGAASAPSSSRSRPEIELPANIDFATQTSEAPEWAIPYGGEWWRGGAVSPGTALARASGRGISPAGTAGSGGTGSAGASAISSAVAGANVGDIIGRVSKALRYDPTRRRLVSQGRGFEVMYDEEGLIFGPWRPRMDPPVFGPQPPPGRIVGVGQRGEAGLRVRTRTIAVPGVAPFEARFTRPRWSVLGNTAQALLDPATGLIEHHEILGEGVRLTWVLMRAPAGFRGQGRGSALGAGNGTENAPGNGTENGVGSGTGQGKNGPMEIRFRIEGSRYRGEDAEGLIFTDAAGRPTVRVGHVTVVDAAGQRWSLTAQPVPHEASELVVVVPAQVLAAAIYPLAIDPTVTVGREFLGNSELPAERSGNQWAPSMVYAPNSDTFAVVWSDRTGSPAWGGVFAARIRFVDGVNGAVQVLDLSPIVVSASTTTALRYNGPAVATDGENFLVAWFEENGLSNGDLKTRWLAAADGALGGTTAQLRTAVKNPAFLTGASSMDATDRAFLSYGGHETGHEVVEILAVESNATTVAANHVVTNSRPSNCAAPGDMSASTALTWTAEGLVVVAKCASIIVGGTRHYHAYAKVFTSSLSTEHGWTRVIEGGLGSEIPKDGINENARLRPTVSCVGNECLIAVVAGGGFTNQEVKIKAQRYDAGSGSAVGSTLELANLGEMVLGGWLSSAPLHNGGGGAQRVVVGWRHGPTGAWKMKAVKLSNGDLSSTHDFLSNSDLETADSESPIVALASDGGSRALAVFHGDGATEGILGRAFRWNGDFGGSDLPVAIGSAEAATPTFPVSMADDNAVPITPMVQGAPSMATDGTRVFWAWEEFAWAQNSGKWHGSWRVRGAIVDEWGEILTPQGIDIANTWNKDERTPKVAFAAQSYLVLWREDLYTAKARRYGPTGAPWTTNTGSGAADVFTVATSDSPTAIQYAVAGTTASDGEFQVLYTRKNGSSNYVVGWRFDDVNSGSSISTSTTQFQSTSDSVVLAEPSFAFVPGDEIGLAAWRQSSSAIQAVKVNDDGTINTVDNTTGGVSPDVACSASCCVMTWVNVAATPDDVLARRVTLGSTLTLGSAVGVDGATEEVSAPAIAYGAGPDQFLIVWVNPTSSTDNVNVRYRRFYDNSGTLTGVDGTGSSYLVAHANPGVGSVPDVVPLPGSKWMVGWRQHPHSTDGRSFVQGSTFNSNMSLVYREGFPVGAVVANQFSYAWGQEPIAAQIACTDADDNPSTFGSGDKCLVVWREQRADPEMTTTWKYRWTIQGLRLHPADGAPVDTSSTTLYPLSTSNSVQNLGNWPVVAGGRDRFLVGYINQTGWPWDMEVVEVALNGDVSSAVSLGSPSAARKEPVIAAARRADDDQVFLVTWAEETSGGGDIFARVVRYDGEAWETLTEQLTLANGISAPVRRPTAAYGEFKSALNPSKGFMVAWEQDNGGSTKKDIVGRAVVDNSGWTLYGSDPVTIAATSDSDEWPSIAFGGFDTTDKRWFMVVHERIIGSDGTIYAAYSGGSTGFASGWSQLAIKTGGTQLRNQPSIAFAGSPAADRTGKGFMVVWEYPGTATESDYALYAAAVTLNSTVPTTVTMLDEDGNGSTHSPLAPQAQVGMATPAGQIRGPMLTFRNRCATTAVGTPAVNTTGSTGSACDASEVKGFFFTSYDRYDPAQGTWRARYTPLAFTP